MARRKNSYDPNQLSLFEYFRAPAAPTKEKLEEISVTDLPNASPIEGLEPVISSGDKPEPVPPPLQAYEPSQTATREEPVRLLETVINLVPAPEHEPDTIQEQNSDYEPDTAEAENLAEPEIVAPDEDAEVPTSSEPVRLGITDLPNFYYGL